MNKDKHNRVQERYQIPFEKFQEMERGILLQEHLKRYGAVRRFCYGNVLDAACGCGYGSYMIALNPDVERVVGLDMDKSSIEWAKQHFAHDKITYEVGDVESFAQEFDTLVCIETIEHIQDTRTIPQLVDRCNIDNVIVSFPDKKTTHYNPHHYHDFVRQELIDLFPNHLIYHEMGFFDSTTLLLTRRPEKAPSSQYRNIRDLHL
jgi:ubiquinone/menaquinone biosynthesis C-methylase UbiE